MEFIDRLEQLINQSGKTKNQIAKDLDLTKNFFINWKNRGNTPDGETLAKLASYFNVSVNYLLGADENPANEHYRRLQALTPEQRLLLENMMCQFEHLNSQSK